MADLLAGKDPRLGGHGGLLSRFLAPWEMGDDFLLKIKHGVLQYVVIKTLLTLLTTFVFLPSGAYGEGGFSWKTSASCGRCAASSQVGRRTRRQNSPGPRTTSVNPRGRLRGRPASTRCARAGVCRRRAPCIADGMVIPSWRRRLAMAGCQGGGTPLPCRV